MHIARVVIAVSTMLVGAAVAFYFVLRLTDANPLAMVIAVILALVPGLILLKILPED